MVPLLRVIHGKDAEGRRLDDEQQAAVAHLCSAGLVKMMEARGWIERQPDRSHGRIIQIRVTETGKELLRKCDAAVARIESSMLADLSNEEFAALQEGMRSSLRALTVMNAGL